MDNNYSDGEDQMPQGQPEDDNSNDKVGESALIPKSLCPNMKVGEEVTLRIVAGRDSEWQVEYEPKESKSDSGDKVMATSDGDYE